MARLEQAMAEAASGDDSGEMRQEARRRAAAVRDAVRPLPAVGSGSNSWTSKGAAARELAEQMARSLEQGALDQAAESARSAAGSLDEAKRQLERGSWLQDPDGTASKEVGDARRKIEAQRAWVEAELEQLRKRTAERAHGQVVESGDQEGKLADRARKLGDRERDKGAFPQEAIEAIDDAARAAHAAADALRRGDAEQGMARQREAQRDLEEASSKLRGEDEEGRPPEETTARPGDNVDIPGKEKHKGPVEFRRRIVHGLAMPTPGGLKDAVRRYAQGLLR
jgi:hypothetical protein